MKNENIELIRKVGRGYQVTLPLEFRKINDIEIGGFLSAYMEGDRLIIEPLRKKGNQALSKMLKLFDTYSGEKEDEDLLLNDVRQEIKGMRSENRSQ